MEVFNLLKSSIKLYDNDENHVIDVIINLKLSYRVFCLFLIYLEELKGLVC